MCHAPTRELVCLPPAGKRRRAEGQPDQTEAWEEEDAPAPQPGLLGCHPLIGRPGEPRATLGSINSRCACPEHGLSPGALRHTDITLGAVGSHQGVLSRGVIHEAVRVQGTNLAAEPKPGILWPPKNSLGMI